MESMMDREICKQLVAETGRILLSKGLVARTWGNISARSGEHAFAISPSGLGYEHMTADDVPVYDYADGTWTGTRKPSSEKKIHAAAYARYSDVAFVIHTHQDYATAAGLADTELSALTEEERAVLGPVRTAAYGLPGTGKLKNNVDAVLAEGCRVVLMKHHGAIILGRDREEAFRMAETLESACKRLVLGAIGPAACDGTADPVWESIRKSFPHAELIRNNYVLEAAEDGGFRSQLDDLAQMIGPRLTATEKDMPSVDKALKKHSAVLVKGLGCVVVSDSEDEQEALKLLIEKGAMTYIYTKRKGIKVSLSRFDCILMEQVFKRKYARKKLK